ncbi:MAG TPA: hypothetical protein VH302_01445 [Bryobacteraceae bacterium]|jgi:hypothetical protein|nr:hypothetical protein [Bryobacteraceae bacterium]
MNRSLALWIGLLGGPVIWLCSFEARFALAPWACTFQNKWALHGIAIAALIFCLCCALIAYGQWKSISNGDLSPDAGAIPRANFMAILGMFVSSGCGMIVIAQSIPEFVLGACM